MRERTLSAVPKITFVLLVLALFAQIAWNRNVHTQNIQLEQLSAPPSIHSMRLTSFGESIGMAKLSMLYLQAFDHQAGQQIALNQLDYQQVLAWLQRIIDLDPSSQYALFAASRLYAEVPNVAKQRLMLGFIYQQFLKDPNRRWASLAYATTLAKHRLKDMPLARQYAQAIRLYATSQDVPNWAKQMEIFLLEDMNELQSAKIIWAGFCKVGK